MRALLLAVLLVTAASLSLGIRSTTAGVTVPVLCFGEPATIVSDIHGAVVLGTGGRDVIFTAGGFGQTIYAYGGDDLICAGVDDVIHAGSGNDTVDVFHAAAVYGESGDDDLNTNDSLLVSGGSGNDTLNGLFDALASGGSGNDVFVGFGVDHCDGGSGLDRVVAGACDATANIP